MIEIFAENFERIVNKYNTLEKRVYDYGNGLKLFRSEIHTINAIGSNENINVTALARLLGITPGGVSQCISKLVKKGMVQKLSSENNELEVRLSLTEKGNMVYEKHIAAHRELYSYLGKEMEELSLENQLALLKVMKHFDSYLDRKLEEK